MTIVFRAENEGDTDRVAGALAKHLSEGDVVALNGPLGAGKTRFVRGLVRGLGLDESQVSSPTYVLSQEYTAPSSRVRLVHIDAYRLTGDDALADLGLESPSAAIFAIEWADRIAGLIDAPTVSVEITAIGNADSTERDIVIACDSERLDAVRADAGEGVSK